MFTAFVCSPSLHDSILAQATVPLVPHRVGYSPTELIISFLTSSRFVLGVGHRCSHSAPDESAEGYSALASSVSVLNRLTFRMM